MRQLKYHEQKLLKKVNLEEWADTNSSREQRVTGKYLLKDRELYHKYNKTIGKIRRLSLALAKLNDNDDLKILISKELINKLYGLGIIRNKTLLSCAKTSVQDICERRLSAVLVSQKMCPDIKTAATFTEQGHVVLGTKTTRDPGVLVSRAMSDFITWSDNSKVKRKIAEFNGEDDDYLL